MKSLPDFDRIQTERSDIVQRIATSAKSSARCVGDITLVAVSKKQPDERIEAMLAIGQRVFGENQVQEAYQRWRDRKARLLDLELRLIGPLQTNKAEQAVGLFDVIETLDRDKLALAIRKAMDKTGRSPRLYIQINTGDEPQKSGLGVLELPGFLHRCQNDYGLNIEGLMCIPPLNEPASLHFALLAKLCARHNLSGCSMGMSTDFELAIQLGATSVRVGTALFGPRPDPSNR